MHALAQQQVGPAAVARVANTGMVAVTASCKTFARRLKFGAYEPGVTRPFSTLAAAREVAEIKFLIVEEASAISNVRMTAHMRVCHTPLCCTPVIHPSCAAIPFLAPLLHGRACPPRYTRWIPPHGSAGHP